MVKFLAIELHTFTACEITSGPIPSPGSSASVDPFNNLKFHLFEKDTISSLILIK